MAGEPGALVLTIFDQLVDRIKSTRPVRSDGKDLTTGFVYSQLVLGMPVDPRDYANPWSPMGGSTLQQSLPPTAPAAGGAAATQPAPDPKFKRAMEAAFKTAELVDTMIMVTNDDSYLEYPTTRHISFAYENIINAMQPTPMPPIAPEVQKQIDEARKVLYEVDDEGNIVAKSQLYKRYIRNAEDYALAKKTYADAQTTALNDPAKADSWPMDAAFYQQKVDEAWDTFKTEGAEKVERALDIIQSVGVSMQDRMIAKARKIYDAWNLGLAGVPTQIPYSYISPTSWCDPDSDRDGWQFLEIDQSQYTHHAEDHTQGHSDSHSQSHSSSTSGGGGFSLGFVSVVGGGSSSSSSSSGNSHWSFAEQNSFHNDAKNLHIELEYALCTIERPWLLGDLFYLRNWYLVNNPKSAISDGTLQGQVENEKPLLPMIPNQFLVVRNVKIRSTDWGSDGQQLASYYGDSSRSASSSSASGGGGVSFGFINLGGSHSERDSQRDSQSNSGSDWSDDYSTRFDGETLEVRGAQIIAWLSEVVPACPPLADPNLPAGGQ